MKVIALTVLHYGKPYLGWAMQSLIDYVDEYWVLYAPNPSHTGGRAILANPDQEWELKEIASTVAGSRLRWVTGTWKVEGQQRDAIYQLCPDADVILVADYDEVWPGEMAQAAINMHDRWAFKYMRMPMIHYWRSFYRCVLYDPALPVRVIYPHKQNGDTRAWDMPLSRPLNHLGYAIPVNYMAYKWSGIHGHQAELRPGWFEDTFLPNRQFDCHPVGSEYWNPETVNPWDYLPSFMKAHPYAKLEVIE